MNSPGSLRPLLGVLLLAVLLITALAQQQGRKPSTSKPAQPAKPAPSARASRPIITNSIGMEFVEIPAGSFWMGSENAPPNCPRDDPFTERNEYQDCMNRYNSNKFDDQETPRHRVTISYSFKIGKYEVTQEQWYKVMGNNPSFCKSEKVGGDSRKHPVENVSWNDVREFIRRLNSMEQTNTYRLPSEAEWEYACRAGTTTQFAFGSSLSTAQANFNGNYPYGSAAKGIYREKTLPVGSFAPNAFGLFDMHGNVYEWCEDDMNDMHSSYNGAPTDGSAWIDARRATYLILRGGGWKLGVGDCRSACRSFHSPDQSLPFYGFRLAKM